MDIYYKSSHGEIVRLDCAPYRMLADTSIFDYEWKYETKRNNRVKNIKKSTKTSDISIFVIGKDPKEYYELATKLYEVFDYDCAVGSPGKLYYGNYYLQCYFYKSQQTEEYVNGKQVSFTIVTDLVDWVKETVTSYRNRQVTGTDVTGIDYPYDHNYDYMSAIQTVNNTSFYPSDFTLTIYGPCAEPMVTVGENVYLVHTDLAKGDYLLIDSRNRKITRVLNDGTRINDFAKRDKEHYIFEKIPQGIQPVSWESNFDFDISILDERGEPKWI